MLAPTVALLTFPERFARPPNPLYFYLGRLVPRHAWEYLPTGCMGQPYGPPELVRAELWHDWAADFFVFALAMAGVALLATLSTGVSVMHGRRAPLLPAWTLFTALLSVLTWAESLWCALSAK